MRVATWNINGIRARFEFLLHWLQARKPDVVGLQELKIVDESFPYEALKDQGYHSVFHAQKSWNGVAILSRVRPTLTQKGLPHEYDMGARLIAADVGSLRFITVYCPNGKQIKHPDFPRKLKWLDSLLNYLAKEQNPNQPMVLCGDFNVCPTPLDTWNEQAFAGEIFHTQEERSRFAQLLEWGLVDAYRTLMPSEQAFSWWDYRGGAFHKNQGLRIDFLLMTRLVQEHIQHIEIDREYRKKKEGLIASDHAPVLVDLSE